MRHLLSIVIGHALLAACAVPDAWTYRVERRSFVHRVTAEGVLKAETTTPLTVPTQVRRSVRLAWLAEDGSLVEEGAVVARFDPTEMRENLEQGRSDLAVAGLEADKSRVVNDLKAGDFATRRQVAELELRHARRFEKTDASVFSRHEIAESRIDEILAAERSQHAADAHATQKSLSGTQLELLAIEERKARLAIEQAEDGLSALVVRAPHAGILTLARDWRGEMLAAGAEMWRGQAIAEIPDLETLQAEVFVLEADAGGLEVGKPATVVVEARPAESFAAAIRHVDAVAKPRFRGSPVQYFGVVLAFDEKPAGMKPGQRVRATLTLEQLDDALVVPRQAILQEAGEARVLVAGSGGFEPRRIETGASSTGLVVVTGGLAGGERIALAPPNAGGDVESAGAPAGSVGSAP